MRRSIASRIAAYRKETTRINSVQFVSHKRRRLIKSCETNPKRPTRRQSQRPQPSCLVLTKAESNESIDYTTEGCTSHAGCGRGSSLTLGKRKNDRLARGVTD